jgi:hypothetical protein
MSGSPEADIARLEERANSAKEDIMEIKAVVSQHATEIGALRRFVAWLMGAAAVSGAILSQVGEVLIGKIK